MIDYISALAAVAIGYGIWWYIDQSDIESSWGSAQEARNYVSAYRGLLKLRLDKTHVKNFRPAFLVLCGKVEKHIGLIGFAQTFRKSYGPIVYGNVATGDFREKTFNIQTFREHYNDGYLLPVEGLPAKTYGFYESVISKDFRHGSQMLLQLAGMGRLKPNTLMIGFKEKWVSASEKELQDYVGTIQDAFRMKMGVVVPRNVEQIQWGTCPELEGRIDVWWLIDDGGLTVLLPHIMKMHKAWAKCDVRLMIVCESAHAEMQQYIHLTELMAKLRLSYKLECVDVEDSTSCKPDTITAFSRICTVDIGEGKALHRVKRWLKVSEKLKEKSSDAALVVMNMPFPRTDLNPLVYMSLLDILSRDMPPMMLMRGNNQNVLTFYCE